MKRTIAVMLLTFPVLSALAQTANVQVNRENKTISVTADHTMAVDPEIAILSFGFRNTSPQKDVAYRDSVRVAGEILKALQDANITDEQISTESLKLERQEQSETKPVKAELLQFDAFQSWTVRVAARDAQAVIDMATKAGANVIFDPAWTVADPVALEAQAYGAALAKARKIAEQMALGLSAQLGDLVYASNTVGPQYPMYGRLSTSMATLQTTRRPEPVLKIFPKKVERRAQVVAIFNIK